MVENMQEKKDFHKIGFTNDFMFCTVMENPKLCKGFLERVLGIEIAGLQYIERQKDIRTGFDTKGIRLDVYVTDVQGNVYDIEMQTVSVAELAKRCRYYHSEMDSYQIRKGAKYSELKKSFVIFVCTFDAIGYDKSVYTFHTACREIPEVTLNDERITVILNTKGNRQGIEPNLVNLLDYIETNQIADDYTKEISKQVYKLQNDRDWRDRYMTLEMKFDEKLEQGRTEGRTEGEIIKVINLVCRKIAKKKTVEEIADDLEEEIAVIQKIYDIVLECGPECDMDVILKKVSKI